MKLNAYAVFDRAVASYMLPFFCKTDDEAVRTLTMSMREDTTFYRFPGDYCLYKVGTYSEEMGQMSADTSEKVVELEYVKSVLEKSERQEEKE